MALAKLAVVDERLMSSGLRWKVESWKVFDATRTAAKPRIRGLWWPVRKKAGGIPIAAETSRRTLARQRWAPHRSPGKNPATGEKKVVRLRSPTFRLRLG
jgi:hypothetical protein